MSKSKVSTRTEYNVLDPNRKSFDLEIFENISCENGMVTLLYHNDANALKFNIINLELKLSSMFVCSKHKVSSVFRRLKEATDLSDYITSKLFIFVEDGKELYAVVSVNNRIYGYSAFYKKKDISKYKEVFLEKLPNNIITVNLNHTNSITNPIKQIGVV